MTLGQKQEQFAQMLPGLLIFVNALARKRGFGVRLGDLFRHPDLHGIMGVKKGYGHANSCHKLKLAIDINFTKDGKIISEYHDQAHDFWDSVGGAKRIPHDMCHYSLEHQGYR